ncbi:hypothetical protein H312_00940 [Anncaliia algerae PRA339]|uniref:Uncharacterized protein n=1 Tax=Anncaliia algerae PRA339 TaxID=1288291 RepID=A0A059F3V2_9MICR|nr:hypothetical protein H312_00940 [Anncaliia algerae PRA339]
MHMQIIKVLATLISVILSTGTNLSTRTELNENHRIGNYMGNYKSNSYMNCLSNLSRDKNLDLSHKTLEKDPRSQDTDFYEPKDILSEKIAPVHFNKGATKRMHEDYDEETEVSKEAKKRFAGNDLNKKVKKHTESEEKREFDTEGFDQIITLNDHHTKFSVRNTEMLDTSLKTYNEVQGTEVENGQNQPLDLINYTFREGKSNGSSSLENTNMDQDEIFVGKYIQDLPDDIILHPYKLKDGNEATKKLPVRKAIAEEFYNYIKALENDQSLLYHYIINLMIKSDGVPICCSNSLFNSLTYELFFDTLREKYIIKENTQNINEFDILYEDFFEFEKLMATKLNLKNLINKENYRYEYNRLCTVKDVRFSCDEKVLLKYFVTIFTSENYIILFKIIPGFNILLSIYKYNMGIKNIIIIARFFQAIIWKFESFRYNFFKQNEISNINLKNLYYNEEFNETITIISIMFGKILSILNLPQNFINLLEIYNFIFFIRAKYNDIYMEYDLNSEVGQVTLTISDTIESRENLIHMLGNLLKNESSAKEFFNNVIKKIEEKNFKMSIFNKGNLIVRKRNMIGNRNK